MNSSNRLIAKLNKLEAVALEPTKAGLGERLAVLETQVNEAVAVPLTQSDFDALMVFVYHVGTGEFLASPLLRKCNEGDRSGAAEDFGCWARAQR